MNNGERYSVRSSPDNEEGQGAKYRKVFEYEGGEIYDHIFLTQMLDNSSMRPIHQQILDTEHTRVAQMRYIVTSLGVPQRCITDV